MYEFKNSIALPLRNDAELPIFGNAADKEKNILMACLFQDGDFVAEGLHLRRRGIGDVKTLDRDMTVPITLETESEEMTTIVEQEKGMMETRELEDGREGVKRKKGREEERKRQEGETEKERGGREREEDVVVGMDLKDPASPL